ncbi:MAG: helix-turn-helix domain-containing protein [Janthinobacterium lividum]
MTPDRLRECLTVLWWSQQQLARVLNKDPRQVRRWASGEYPMPVETAAWLERLARFHERNPPP